MVAGDELRAWELLVRFHREATGAMDGSLRQRFELGLDDYDVLHQLSLIREPLPMTELARRLLVANSSCNRLVGRLVERGLVERRPGADDRRRVLVSLTRAGRRLHRRMATLHTRDIHRLLIDRLSERERHTIEAALGRLLADDPDNGESAPRPGARR